MRKFLLPVLVLLGGWSPEPALVSPADPDEVNVCVMTDPPVYYAIDLVSTRKLPGTRLASGTVDMTFQASPFVVSVGSGGHYQYDLHGRIQKLKPPASGVYVVWLSSPDLTDVRLVGALDDNAEFQGVVDLQKFLVIVTLEDSFDPKQVRWEGPVALRGLSRSGRMHTMAGHGPFTTEPCAFYGYR